MKQVVI